MKHFKIAAAGVIGFLLAGASLAAPPQPERDYEWVSKKVRDCQPTADERKFDQIGWLTDLRTAEKLAREHSRPVFLFTHDGHMAIGRC